MKILSTVYRLIILVVLSIVLYGIVIPSMISSFDNITVVGGIFGLFITIPLMVWLFIRQIIKLIG